MARSATPPEFPPLSPGKPDAPAAPRLGNPRQPATDLPSTRRRARSASRRAPAPRASCHASPLACPGLRCSRAFAAGTSPLAAIRTGSGTTRSEKPTRQASHGSPKTGSARPAAPSPGAETRPNRFPGLFACLGRLLGPARPSGSLPVESPGSPGSSADARLAGPAQEPGPLARNPAQACSRAACPGRPSPAAPKEPLAVCPWPEARNRPRPPSPRPGRGRAPPDLADAVPAGSPRPAHPAAMAGRTDRNGEHPPRGSPLTGRLSLSRVGRVGRTGQERSSRRLVRLGGGRPAVCPGNPLTTAGLPRIRPGRRRLHPAAPSRPFHAA